MTIGGQVKQTVASLRGVQATLETFASLEANQESNKLLEDNAARINGVIRDMEERVRVLELEEPQYKGF